MSVNNFHIFLKYPEYFPEPLVQEDLKIIQSDGLKIKLDRPGFEVYAALEWAVPTVLLAYIAKSYFDSFLAEAGKDHFHALNNYLKNLVIHCKEFPVKTVTASKSTKKNTQSGNQSKGVSIIFQLKDKRLLKLLFDDRLEIKDWYLAIDDVTKMVFNHHHGKTETTLDEILEKESPDFFAIIDFKTKRLKFYTEREIINHSIFNKIE